MTVPTFVCEMAFGNNPGDASPTWTDVSTYLRSFHVQRGRAYELNQMEAGRCQLTLKNTDRRFDPTYASSPYYPNLRPMVPVRIRAANAVPVDASPALTLSGNEITDATRTTGTQGDGLTAPAGIGIWEATTNLITNGGLETNKTGWATAGAAGTTLSQDTSTFKYGTACGKFVTDGVNGSQGAQWAPGTPMAATAALVYSASVWVKGSGSVAVDIQWRDSGAGLLSTTTGTTVALGSAWQWISVTGTAPASTAQARLRVISKSSAATVVTCNFDGAQFEQKPIATPYVETNGSTASRSAARVQEAATRLDETTGSIVVRFAPGWSTTAMPGGGTGKDYLFDWRDDANNRLSGYFDEASKKFTMERYSGGSGSQAQSAVQTLTKDTSVTVEFSWSSTLIGVRVNGGTKVTTANTNIPVLAATLFDIGATFAVGTPTVGTSQCDGRIRWSTTFSTVPSDTDAATIGAISGSPTQTNSIYDHDASVLLWPSTATVTSYWPAVTSTYRVPSDGYAFTGYVERFPQQRTGPTYAETTVEAVDGFELLTNSVLPGAAYPQELSSARVTRVLNAVSWSSSARNINTGQSNMVAYTFTDADNVQPLTHLNDVAQSELGIYYISASGKATFIDRKTVSEGASLLTLTDQPSTDTTAIGYADITASYDKDLIVNDWRGTGTYGGAVTQEALDSQSISRYFQRTQTRAPLLTSDTEILSQMQYLLSQYKEPALRFDEVTLTLGASSAAWIHVLGRDLGDRLTVKDHPPGGGTLTQDELIQRVDLDVPTHAANATCKWGMLSAALASYFILDNATSGTLDNNRVGF